MSTLGDLVKVPGDWGWVAADLMRSDRESRSLQDSEPGILILGLDPKPMAASQSIAAMPNGKQKNSQSKALLEGIFT